MHDTRVEAHALVVDYGIIALAAALFLGLCVCIFYSSKVLWQYTNTAVVLNNSVLAKQHSSCKQCASQFTNQVNVRY